MAKSILCGNDYPVCFITGNTLNLDRHHVLNGALRDWAEQEGLWIYLNHTTHMWIHQTGAGKQVMMKLKRYAQMKWEEVHADEYEDVRAEWMKKVRKNYVL